jgi:hypothetical protein
MNPVRPPTIVLGLFAGGILLTIPVFGIWYLPPMLAGIVLLTAYLMRGQPDQPFYSLCAGELAVVGVGISSPACAAVLQSVLVASFLLDSGHLSTRRDVLHYLIIAAGILAVGLLVGSSIRMPLAFALIIGACVAAFFSLVITGHLQKQRLLGGTE